MTYILHTYINNMFDNLIQTTYQDFIVIKKEYFEEGIFVLIRNNKKNEKIIGIVPRNSTSIYTPNETFKIIDFTDKIDHFIHKKLCIYRKPVIICDEQGGILCLNRYIQTNFLSSLKNISRIELLENYEINYESFYNIANSYKVNDVYAKLTDEDKIIEFLLDL